MLRCCWCPWSGRVVRLGVLDRMRQAAVGVSWRRSEQGVLRQRQLDGQAFALATVDVDGVELAAADSIQDGLFGHAESAGSLGLQAGSDTVGQQKRGTRR